MITQIYGLLIAYFIYTTRKKHLIGNNAIQFGLDMFKILI